MIDTIEQENKIIRTIFWKNFTPILSKQKTSSPTQPSKPFIYKIIDIIENIKVINSFALIFFIFF